MSSKTERSLDLPSDSDEDSNKERLSEALGGRTKIKILHELTHESPQRQYELADSIGVSEAAISRAKPALTYANLVTKTPNGLSIHPRVKDAYTQLIIHISKNTP